MKIYVLIKFQLTVDVFLKIVKCRIENYIIKFIKTKVLFWITTFMKMAVPIKNLKSISRNLSTNSDNIFTKLSKNTEKYEFERPPVGCLYSLAETTASASGQFVGEARIYFAFQTIDQGMLVDESLEKIIFRHDYLEINVINVLIDSLDDYPLLSVIRFEFCHLTARHIEELVQLLYLHNTVKEISVNGNPIPEQNYYLLLQREICYLSLKYCSITTEGIKKICEMLCKPHENPLLHLDLASNALSDEGVFYVGKLLRMNRTLLSVNLADNKITNLGLKTVLEALQKFELDEDEVIERRRIKFYHQKKINDFTNKSRETMSSITKKTKFTKSKLKILERRSLPPVITIPPVINIELPYHPTLQDSVEQDGHFFCNGNAVLSYINLSYNKITRTAIPYIINMLNYQKQQFNNTNTKALTRISLEGNMLSTEDEYQVQNAVQQKFSDCSISASLSLSEYQEKKMNRANSKLLNTL